MMAVLVYLASRPGEVVTREELERDVWNSRSVSYAALTGCITKLRKTLGDDSRNPRYIETIAKKGYRLIASVSALPLTPAIPTPTPLDPVAVSTPQRARLMKHWITAGLAVVMSTALYFFVIAPGTQHTTSDAPGVPSIAVLPFNNLNPDATQDYLSDGITADITTALSGHSGLFVIAYPSVLGFKDQNVDATRAAHALAVRYILQGTVQRTDLALRVNAQLIDAQTGVNLWAERYDREMKDVFAVQDDITARIVSALEVKLTAEEKQRAARRYTVSVDAYDAFLRGQSYFARRTLEDNLAARKAYEQATALDRNFARAYSALALTYTNEYRFRWQDDSKASLARALSLAQEAVSLDDTLPQTYWVLGHVRMHRHEFAESMEAEKQAIRLDPNFADSYMALASTMIYQNEADAALPLIRKAMRLNPRYPAQYAEILGRAYFVLHRYEEAVVALRDSIERNANMLPAYVLLTAASVALGNTDEATWMATQLHALAPEFKSGDIAEIFPFEDKAQLAAIADQLDRAGI